MQLDYCIYRDEFEQLAIEVHALRGELRRAIENDELLLHYQPKVDLESGVVNGVEALVRWQHPERGLIYPDEFIPLAEQTGLIQALSIVVLKMALRQSVAWHRDNLDLSVAVNISACNLMEEQFPQRIAELLKEYEAPPEWLELEITETGVMTNPVLAVQTVRALSAMGVRLAIDDFGTGYSSMAYLKKLLAAKIKIDKSFIADMSRDDNDAVIVRSAIELGHNLGLRVVAEGVEDSDTLALLKTLGCDSVQGYYLSRPVPAVELEAWMNTSSWKPARLRETSTEASPTSRDTDTEAVCETSVCADDRD